MAVLRRHQLSAPTIFSRNYHLINPSFFTTFQNLWKKLSDDPDGTISKKVYDPFVFHWEDYYVSYVREERPKGSRPWWEINNLLMPVNVDSYRWVLAAVNIVERKIRVYDSLCQDTNPSFRSNISPYLHIFYPYLCATKAIMKISGEKYN
ncbi:hypothetical protein ACOSQ2_020374 [Xanthoceras sorbifolium]